MVFDRVGFSRFDFSFHEPRMRLKFCAIFRHFLLHLWDFFQNFSSRFGSGNGRRLESGGGRYLKYRSPHVPNRVGQSPPALPFLHVSLPQGPACVAFCHLGPFRRSQTWSSHWPANRRAVDGVSGMGGLWPRAARTQKKESTHGSATPSRRPRVRAAESPAPGRRLPSCSRMPARRGDG